MRAHLTHTVGLVMTFLIIGCIGGSLLSSQLFAPILAEPTQPVSKSEFTLPAATPDPRCLPPCFYSVIPGKTTITDTFKLLGATSLQIGDQNNGALIWTTQRSPREWNAAVVLVENSISFRQGIVSSIHVHSQQNITLQSVVSKYGDPEAVTVGSPGPVAVFDTILLYPTKGLAVIGTWLPHLDTRSEVYSPHPETLVDSEIYFAPVNPIDLSVDDVNSWRTSYVEEIYPWPGFGNSMEPH